MPLYLGIDSVYSLDPLSTTHEAYHPPPRWYALSTTRAKAMAITMYTSLLLIIREEVIWLCRPHLREEGIPTNSGLKPPLIGSCRRES